VEKIVQIKNRDRLLEYHKEYHKKNREEFLSKSKEYYKNNKQIWKEYVKVNSEEIKKHRKNKQKEYHEKDKNTCKKYSEEFGISTYVLHRYGIGFVKENQEMIEIIKLITNINKQIYKIN